MSVRVVSSPTSEEPTPEQDYLHVRVSASPEDDTVTLATIERYVGRSGDIDATESKWRVRTLFADQPMTPDEAVGFATCYAERKHIALVVDDRDS